MEKENLGNRIVQFVDNNLERAERIQSLVEKSKDQAIEFGRIENEKLKIEAETYTKLQEINNEHNQIMSNMDRHYNQQKESMNNMEKIIDKGLNSDNIDMLEIGIRGMLGTIQNKFSSDGLRRIEKKNNIADDDIIEL
ncbi:MULTISPECIES: hypothetical protein [Arcobacteraceae]|uniref:hypothetical protein n=1 Tax=Arcobacteraceae TaxID=2808963 RepID=UPI000DEB368C|nr:hypothetical protein [Arcobacter sp. CECT 9188]RBQ27786.1 hypothetical protein CRU88_03705 [Arcobacter sp. CECT 9188]